MELLVSVGSPRDVRNFESVLREAGLYFKDASIHYAEWVAQHRTGEFGATYYVVRTPDEEQIRTAIHNTSRNMGASWDSPMYRVLDSRPDQSHPAE